MHARFTRSPMPSEPPLSELERKALHHFEKAKQHSHTYYHKHKHAINKQRALLRIAQGLPVRPTTLLRYNISPQEVEAARPTHAE